MSPETVQEKTHMAGRPIISMKEQEEALRDNRIVGFHCQGCKYDQFSPMLRCPKCRSSDITTREFSITGTVESYTIQTVAAEQFLNETPFAFVVVKLDDGPRISGWIEWIARPSDLPMGQKVQFRSSYKPGMIFDKV